MGGVAPLRRAYALGVPLRGGEVWARACSRGSCGRERMRRRARSARGGGAVRSGGPGDRVGVEAAEHAPTVPQEPRLRSEEHTSELQSQSNLVCRLLLEKKKK